MPITFSQRTALINDTDLRDRVARAIAKTASYVNAGGTGISTLSVHRRAVIAEANPGSEVNVFLEILAQSTEETVAASITDAAVEYAVNANYQRVWGSGL